MNLRFALSDVAHGFVDTIVKEMQRPIAKAATAAVREAGDIAKRNGRASRVLSQMTECVAGERLRGVVAALLFCVALRPKPLDFAAARHPVVNIRLARKPLDVAVFEAGILGDYLPVSFGDPLHLEHDSW
jgi:hypothetical protein